MKTILSWLMGNIWPAVGAAVLVLVLSGAVYVEHERLSAANARLSATETARDQWKANFTAANETAQANAATLQLYQDMTTAAEAKADAARQAQAALQSDYDALKRRIHDAPATDDGPVAPVLRAALGGLRQ
jgi:hypothetical protein